MWESYVLDRRLTYSILHRLLDIYPTVNVVAETRIPEGSKTAQETFYSLKVRDHNAPIAFRITKQGCYVYKNAPKKGLSTRNCHKNPMKFGDLGDF